MPIIILALPITWSQTKENLVLCVHITVYVYQSNEIITKRIEGTTQHIRFEHKWMLSHLCSSNTEQSILSKIMRSSNVIHIFLNWSPIIELQEKNTPLILKKIHDYNSFTCNIIEFE